MPNHSISSLFTVQNHHHRFVGIVHEGTDVYLDYGPYSKQAPGINMQNRTVNADPYGIRINQILYQNIVVVIQQKFLHEIFYSDIKER